MTPWHTQDTSQKAECVQPYLMRAKAATRREAEKESGAGEQRRQCRLQEKPQHQDGMAEAQSAHAAPHNQPGGGCAGRARGQR